MLHRSALSAANRGSPQFICLAVACYSRLRCFVPHGPLLRRIAPYCVSLRLIARAGGAGVPSTRSTPESSSVSPATPSSRHSVSPIGFGLRGATKRRLFSRRTAVSSLWSPIELGLRGAMKRRFFSRRTAVWSLRDPFGFGLRARSRARARMRAHVCVVGCVRARVSAHTRAHVAYARMRARIGRQARCVRRGRSEPADTLRRNFAALRGGRPTSGRTARRLEEGTIGIMRRAPPHTPKTTASRARCGAVPPPPSPQAR